MGDQRFGAGQAGGLRPPPGFENLVSNQGIEAGAGVAATPIEESNSSTSSSSALGAALGIFPFPAPEESPRSPPRSSTSVRSSAASGCSILPEVSSEYTEREKMEATNAFFFGHHHEQMVANMAKKFQDLLDYDKTKNRKILHIDWIAGNPTDPIKTEGNGAHGGMSAEDRRLSESVARSVMRITHDVAEWDETETWNKSLFYGDWLNNHKGLRQFFIEIQVKRISGADDELLEKCGISPEYVWLPLHNDKAPAITPIVIPLLVPQQFLPQPAARELPNPHQAACEPIPEVEEEEYATPAPAPSLEVPTCSADKGKGKAVAPPVVNPAAPVIVSSDNFQSAQKRTPLPNIGDLALRQQDEADTTAPSGSPSAPRTGIPRSQPLHATGSLESLESTQSGATDSSDESYQEEGTIYLSDDVDPFDALLPAHATPAVSAADLHRQREEFDRNSYAKREELARIFSFLNDPAFVERKNKSFVYAVRIVAVPDRGNVVNEFNGPPVSDRYGTLLAQGGWVVPPLQERVQWRDEHKRSYRNKGARLGKYGGLPRPQIQNAMPMRFDWSGGTVPRYFGPAPPLWRELCDPCMEDIYWMAWQLLSGKQFLGFRPGAGFGVVRRDPAGDQEMLHKCQFKSPSTEALYHAASYPRGKETK